MPQWYKQRHGVRGKAQSGAARVARFRPPRLGGAEHSAIASATLTPSVRQRPERRTRGHRAAVRLPPGRAARPADPRRASPSASASACCRSGPARPASTTCWPRRWSPTCRQGGTLIATNVISPFLVPLKITLMAAFLLALPVVLYQVWAFVAPGLYTHEKKLVLPLVVSSTLLFFARRGVLLLLRLRPGVHASSRASRRRASPRRRTSRPT